MIEELDDLRADCSASIDYHSRGVARNELDITGCATRLQPSPAP